MGQPRRVAALVAGAILLAAIAPAQPVSAAGLPAPVMVSPVATTASGAMVEFVWQRVTGAAAYNLRVRSGGPDGTTHVSVQTVNVRHIALVNFAGDPAWWEVAAVNGNGIEGAVARASFTTARIAPTLVWPHDGSTLNHPDQGPDLEWASVPDQPDALYADQDVGSQAPLGNPPSRFGLGAWRWGVRSTRPPPGGTSPSPPSEIRTFSYAWPGATPVLTSPADDHALAADEALRLRWEPVPGAALYSWEMAVPGEYPAEANNTGTRATWADVVTSGYPDDLPPGPYEWRVRAMLSGTVDQPEWGPWSASRTVVIPGSPATPALLSPPDGATLASWPVLRWEDLAGDHGYAVQVSDAPDPGAEVTSSTAGTASFSFHPVGDPAHPNPMYQAVNGSTTRFWRVQGVGTRYGFDTGDWSAWRSFTVTAPVGSITEELRATPLGPTDCASEPCPDLDGLPLLRWQPVGGAVSYRLFVRWDGGQGSADTWFDTGSTGLALPRYEQASTDHRVAWAVLACPQAGCSTTMPGERSRFRVSLPPPVQIGASDGAVQGAPSVEMSWIEPGPPVRPDTLGRPLGTEIEYTLAPGNYGASDLYRTVTGFPYLTVDGIKDSVTLAWRVRTRAEFGYLDHLDGAWSPWRSITRDEPAVEILSPSPGEVLDATPVLGWAGLPYSVAGYQVELARTSTLAAMGQQHADWGAHTGATSVHLPELAPGEYRWRVRRAGAMYFGEDGEGAWSTGTFTIAGSPVPRAVSPAAGASVRADDAVMSWEPFPVISWVGHHCIQVATSPGFADEAIAYAGCSEYDVTSHPVPRLLPTGDQYWRICASFDCSEPRLLHVDPAPGPDLTAPVTSGVRATPAADRTINEGGSVPVTIRWSAADGGTGIGAQELQLRRGSGAWTSVPVSATARSATALLKPGNAYTARIRATDRSDNVGAWVEKRIVVALRQESSWRWSWSGRWTRSYARSASGVATRWSTRAGATASTRVTASSVGIVAPRSSGRGNAHVYVDGRYMGTIRLNASPTGARRIAWIASWPSVETHRVTVRVSGTAGRPRVDVDAIVILR